MGAYARTIGVLALAATLGAAETAAESTSLPATRDVRISFYSSELNNNGGQSTRLRARQLGGTAGECVLMDFDHGAITSFVKAHRGKQITVKLRLWSLGVGGGAQGKLEACVFDSPVDWVEGQQSDSAAAKGESCGSQAQFDVKPWQRLDGTSAADLRDVIYDKGFNHLNMLANGPTTAVTNAALNQQVELELEPKFVEHLALDPKCRGIVLFTRDDAFLDFYSREQSGKAPELVLTAAAK